ncbi:hypothetical protein [Halococcoides cellulosivorans]|uniref:Uncharacterized protein n=1 Tax=Halococcoides cellulosivorans TaxID=1679096 RepID=A0A2R4X382_9EURY|nr:hypothetical protein [Halococcoides cellulosivorans]AWB28261.1 hypothetical protein HARCEL1_11385 [Halococcoides cellulosivorans]
MDEADASDDRSGDRVEVIDRGDRQIELPIPDDPLAALRAEVADCDRSVAKLVADAEREALDEAGRPERRRD